MTVKEFASMFEMSVSELSDFTGYSRQALYNIIECNSTVQNRRYKAMLKSLKLHAWKKMCEKQNEVQTEYDRRIEALEELENRKRNYPGSDCVETINTEFEANARKSITVSNYCK